MNGFDSLAPVYDFLARIVFGKAMVSAQTSLLHTVRDGDSVLILGGGTGWILEELLRKQPHCEVWYIDSSSKMIERAKKRNTDLRHIHFVVGTTQSIPPMKFDVVIMNFFLDLFSDAHVVSIVSQLKTATQPTGRWIITDFEDEGRWWQKMYLKIMIFFFRMICGIEADKLVDIRPILAKQRVTKGTSHSFFHGFIKSTLYHPHAIN